MIKIFLVEDEIVVREGIKNNINWVENGFLFCGEASDGELAYPLIQKAKPDIVITDIRMPFMDGLELSRLIKKEMPMVKIIILSGYGEFDYAKEAINIGITEYLLKPINGANLLSSVKGIAEIIKKEQEEKENYNKFLKDIKENEIEEKWRLFHDLVSNSDSLASILERGRELNLELTAPFYNIILLQIGIVRGGKKERETYPQIWQEINDLAELKGDAILFDCSIEGKAILLKGSSLDELNKIQDYYIRRLREILDRANPISYFGGIGKAVGRLGELSMSYYEASRAFAYRYIWDINEILDYETIPNGYGGAAQAIDFNMENISQLDKRKVEAFLKSGEIEEVHFFVGEYLKSLGNECRNSILFRQYLVMDMYFIVTGFLEDLGYGTEVIDKPFKDSREMNIQISSLELTKGYIENIFLEAMEIRNEVADKHYNGIIKRAKEYIMEHYAEEDLSLNQVAARVYISPSHFSTVFSQKTGRTFVKYLTDIRMNKAKELLKCTDLKTSEIGYMVGYKDPHYFSYLFKKTQNCTPKQYRFL
ncbi:response regulator [Anaerocolumna sp. MB42-C2]|uniref:response regulator n=1 Tax=Anaerocolumna sp. MB42-C2 TaxID=3070997 RepID=UPI0027DF4FA0|nr:response regulator [Anaerocolumna sp. MB42-C2]WMJ87127.1 response regulator [Anaerocolumna sp. MB42-C2]